MKILHYVFGAAVLLAGIDIMFTASTACPRCRRALPKGPIKRPHPGFPKKITQHNSPQNNPKENVNEQK